MATKAPVRPLNQTPVQVAKAAKAEKERKAASKAALRESRKPAKSEKAEKAAPAPAPVPPVDAPAVAPEFVDAIRADAAALGLTGEAADAYVADQIGPATKAAKVPYNGPMIALKTARRAYVKAANGIPCNGDRLAILCGRFSREHTVRALILALGLGSNPYSHLNPGQQSMNLRNKARHAVSEGRLSFALIEAAYEQTATVAA